MTRTFTVTQDENNSEYDPYVFNQQTVDNWLSNNSSDLTTVGSVVTITGDFADVINNLNNNGRFKNRKSLLDLGKEITICNSAESRLLVLRKVRAEGTAANAGNKTSIFFNDSLKNIKY